MRKILVIGPSWVGDMMMSQSLYKLLKRRFNDHVQIDVLAPAWTFSLLTRMQEVNQAIEMPVSHGELNIKLRWEIAKKLQKVDYDQAIILPNSFKSALVPWLASIPVRTGYARELRSILLTDARKLDKQNNPLMVEQYLALGLPTGEEVPKDYPLPSLTVSILDQEKILQKHKPLYGSKPILGICAGAEFGPSKRWPENYYAEIANQKLEEGWDVWLFGSPKDRTVTDKIMALTQNRCENLAGRLVLAETIDLLSLTSGLVTNDSGLMHVACALKKPLVAIYGSTSPDFTPPLSKNAKVLKLNLSCQPCFERNCPLTHHQCMRDVTPMMVAQAMSTWKF